jgi:hypothetical protein
MDLEKSKGLFQKGLPTLDEKLHAGCCRTERNAAMREERAEDQTKPSFE